MKTNLLLSIIAISFNAIAQNHLPIVKTQFPAASQVRNIMDYQQNNAFPTSGAKYEMNRGKSNLQNLDKQLLVQQIDSIYNWMWSSQESNWQLNSRTINLTFNANNDLTGELIQSWDSITNTWQNEMKWAYTFDANYNRTSQLAQSWNNGAWVNTFRYNWEYDANNNEISELFQQWNGSSWENMLLNTSAYNSVNNITSLLSQLWIMGAYMNLSLVTYSYDGNNILTSSLMETWNGSAWMNSSQNTYSYNAGNYLISDLQKTWNGTAWENSNLTTHTYDNGNNVTIILQEIWDGSAWINDTRLLNTYDDKNNYTGNIAQMWNGSAWWNTSVYDYTYDANDYIYSISGKNYTETGIAETGDSSRYYYATATGINNIVASGVAVYPNPAKGKFYISSIKQISGIQIYNLTGDLIYSDFNSLHPTPSEIDISNVPKGIYVLKINIGNKIFNKKVVIQ